MTREELVTEYVQRHQFTEGGLEEIVASKIARGAFLAGYNDGRLAGIEEAAQLARSVLLEQIRALAAKGEE